MLRAFSMRSLQAAIVLAVCGSVFGQEVHSDIPPITIRANTRLVTVGVVAADKKGRPITNLKADDFSIEEGGKKQKISVFVAPNAAETGPAQLPDGVFSNRAENISAGGALTVLVLDAANSPFKDQAYARNQMLKYVLEQGESGRKIAVMTLTNQLHVLQQFTSDPSVLRKAIRDLRPQEPTFGSAGPAPLSAATGSAGTGPRADLMLASAAQSIRGFQSEQVGFELERRTLVTIAALHGLSRLLGGLPGRKNVVWLTATFPFDLIPENRSVSEAQLVENLPSHTPKSIGTTATGTMASEQRQLHGEEIRRVEAELAAADIALYPVDIRGLMSGMELLSEDTANRQSSDIGSRALVRMSDAAASQATLRELAAETGGIAYVNQNEINVGVAMAMADGTASYTLGYYPENKKWDGKYRTIKVKLSQPDSQVRYRRGYFAIDPAQAKTRKDDQDIANALLLGAPSTQVTFRAQCKLGEKNKIRAVFLVDAGQPERGRCGQRQEDESKLLCRSIRQRRKDAHEQQYEGRSDVRSGQLRTDSSKRIAPTYRHGFAARGK